MSLTLAPKYRDEIANLLCSSQFITDGGIETSLIYDYGVDIPCFASFQLLKDEQGTDILRQYYEVYLNLAQRLQVSLLLYEIFVMSSQVDLWLETPTWRASSDWANKLNISLHQLSAFTKQAVELLAALREKYSVRVILSGNIGPRGDGYVVDHAMSTAAAQMYHSSQITTFAATTVDVVTALTLNYVEEAIGVALAARDQQLPVVIGFTVEVNGNLPSGMTLCEAITATDLATSAYALGYIINCAHPTHFSSLLIDASERGEAWVMRLCGLRANASKLSHAELDTCTTLDSGDPTDYGNQFAILKGKLPQLKILGGCCGTDARHIEAVAISCHLIPK